MDPRIKKYLVNDIIFNEIDTLIALEPTDIRTTNVHLKTVLKELIEIMQMQNPLFKETHNKIVWTGSFYKKTKVDSPDEFDLNLIIQLPIKAENIKFNTELPGYTKIYIDTCKIDSLNMGPNAYRDMKSFIDDQSYPKSYLNQEKFRRWIEKILSSAANIIDQNNKLKNYNIKIKKSGPAFTLLLQSPSRISIDLVPVLAVSDRCYAPPCTRNYTSPQNCERYWFLVPKPLNNKQIFGLEQHHYWRLSFYEFEKDILSKYGRAKPIIRHLKKLRDTQKWKCIASYYIETLCFHHLHIFETSNSESSSFLFFMMLKKLYEAFCTRRIEHYWDKKLNLLENIEYREITNMEGRLSNIIKKIEKQIIEKPSDPFVIATYILNSDELLRLKSNYVERQIPESELKPKAEKLKKVRGKGTHSNPAPQTVRGKGTHSNPAPQTMRGKGTHSNPAPQTVRGKGTHSNPTPQTVRGKETHSNPAPQTVRESQGRCIIA